MILRRLLLSLLLIGLVARPAAAALTVDSLRVENRVEPLGVDVLDPRFSWIPRSAERGQRQTGYQVLVASSAERLAQDEGDVWDSGKVPSDQTFGVAYAGRALEAHRWYFWKVRTWDRDGRASTWSSPASWQVGMIPVERTGRSGDRQREDEGGSPWHAAWIGAEEKETSPLLRKEFLLEKPIASAVAYAYALGWYELWINGRKAGPNVLAPVVSNLQKTLFYDTYDVTTLLRSGANALGLWMGGGYNANFSKYGYRWLEPMAARVQVEVRYTDGTSARLTTDDTWKTAPSAITQNHIYDGETYDARREQRGWSEPGFSDAGWTPVTVRPVNAGPLRARTMPAIQVMATLQPVALNEPQPGVFVYDLGQNIAGWARLKVAGPAGARITLRHAEELNPDGMLDPRTNRAAKATDAYILRGDASGETYEPRFTYHGFRYVEVTGFPGRPTLESLEGRAVHAGFRTTGHFTSSDPLLNRLHENFRWTIRNNLMGTPTDTAVRDERTPCSMDAVVVEEAAMYNFDVHTTFTKWLRDITGDRGMPPNWAGDQVLLPLFLYQHYGDRRVLEEQFEPMQAATDAFAAEAEAKKYWADGFGDWAAPNPAGDYPTSFSEGEITNTVFFHACATATAEAARALGAAEAERKYAALAARIAARFHEKHFRASSHTYGSGRQSTSVLPLAHGLVPPPLRAPVAAALRQRIVTTDGGRLDTGIFGTRYLFDTLIDAGMADTAYEVLKQPAYPGFAHQVSLGATTAWEQWSWAGGMQTHDHLMFAGPDVTFYTRLAGIRAAAPGFRQIVIRPTHPRGLRSAGATVETVSGTVVSEWEFAGGYEHRVTVPVNTTATVYVPAAKAEAVREGNGPAANAPGVRYLRQDEGYAVFAVSSGEYRFTVPER